MLRSALTIVSAAALLLAGFTFAGRVIGLWDPVEPGDSGALPVRVLDRPDFDAASRAVPPVVVQSKPSPPVSLRLALLIGLACLALSVLPVLARLPRRLRNRVVAPPTGFPHRPCERTVRFAAGREPGPEPRSAGAANAEGAPEPAAQVAWPSRSSDQKSGAARSSCSSCSPSGSRIRGGACGDAYFGCPSWAISSSSNLRRDDPSSRMRGPLIPLRISRRHRAGCRSRGDDRPSCRTLRELMTSTRSASVSSSRSFPSDQKHLTLTFSFSFTLSLTGVIGWKDQVINLGNAQLSLTLLRTLFAPLEKQEEKAGRSKQRTAR